MKLAAILLAAGQSARFGPDNKLYAPVGGRPMLAVTIELLTRDVFAQRVMVFDPADPRAAGLARAADVEPVANPQCRLGMGTSLAIGAGALAADIDAVFIFLADMPIITPATVAALAGALRNHDNPHDAIIVPGHNGQRGHPVVFGAGYFDQLTAATGDSGAREIVAGASVTVVTVDDPGILCDVDRPGDIASGGTP